MLTVHHFQNNKKKKKPLSLLHKHSIWATLEFKQRLEEQHPLMQMWCESENLLRSNVCAGRVEAKGVISFFSASLAPPPVQWVM